ncbi:MAG TPA: G1 family glutamic endopeptidase, partial [Candidatus Bathyarchaeia archaeon]|nr:G1 family glutamic endopeptidase [Candidatus Bathyarchaeia archaeon]
MYVPAKKIRLFFPALIVCFILGILLLNLSFPSFAQTAKAHSHPIIKTHSSSVKTPFGIRNQVDSTNWAGYAVTGTDVSDVVGTYIQPAVSCSSQTTYVATWVGIDGYSSSTVEQTGTLAECIDGI